MTRPMNRILPMLIYSLILEERNGARRKKHNGCWISTLQRSRMVFPGNDDTGTMSAWAIFNMIGFYPDCPGLPEYTLTTPVFNKVTIRLDPKWYKEKN